MLEEYRKNEYLNVPMQQSSITTQALLCVKLGKARIDGVWQMGKLLQYSRDKNIRSGETPARADKKRGLNIALFNAVEAGNAASVVDLLDKGAELEARNDHDMTPLMIAAGEPQLPVMRLLMSRGADVNAKTHDGNTVLMMAAFGANDEAVSLLLERGVDIEAQDQEGKTALMWAVFAWGELDPAETIRLLLSRGANPNIRDNNGRDVLMWAIQLNKPDSAMELIRSGADMKARYAGGLTPLLWAASWGSAEIVGAMLERGADPEARDEAGLSAMDWARKKENTPAIEVLCNIGDN